jgi:hypothetical protein
LHRAELDAIYHAERVAALQAYCARRAAREAEAAKQLNFF